MMESRLRIIELYEVVYSIYKMIEDCLPYIDTLLYPTINFTPTVFAIRCVVLHPQNLDPKNMLVSGMCGYIGMEYLN